MPSANWTDEAEEDLEEILFYIGYHDSRWDTAEKIGREIDKKCNLIATQPGMGQPRPDLGEGYRLSLYKRWVIVFRPIDDGIEVMRVVDGARDFKKLFDQ